MDAGDTQGLLEAVHRCKPVPQIAAPILRFAGRTFNAWHSALSILEDQITTLQYASDGRKDDPEEVRARTLCSVSENSVACPKNSVGCPEIV